MKDLGMEELLAKLAELRKQLPGIEDVHPAKDTTDGRFMLADGIPAKTEKDFEFAAVRDAVASFGADVEAIEAKEEAQLMEQALGAYYVIEELARDPANAELIPHVEKLRKAYESDFGRPIPPRKP